MHLNKSYLPKYRLVGFSKYYETDKGDIVNKSTNRFISVNRDKGRAWQYYSLVNDKGIRVKIGIDKLIRKPYFSDGIIVNYSKEVLESSRLLGLVD